MRPKHAVPLVGGCKPDCKKSGRSTGESDRVVLKVEDVDPDWAVDRIDIVGSRCKKSSANSNDPKQPVPKRNRCESMRAWLRAERGSPKCKESRAEGDGSVQVQLNAGANGPVHAMLCEDGPKPK